MHPSPMNVYGELSVVNDTVQWSKLSMCTGILFIYFIYFVYMDPKNFPKIFVRNSAEIHRNIVDPRQRNRNRNPANC